MQQAYCPTCGKVTRPRVVMEPETALFKGHLVIFEAKECYCSLCKQRYLQEESREYDFISMQAEHDRQTQTASTYTITLVGCDDETEIDMSLTYEQVLLVRQMVEKVAEASTYGCMPIMFITYKELKDEPCE